MVPANERASLEFSKDSLPGPRAPQGKACLVGKGYGGHLARFRAKGALPHVHALLPKARPLIPRPGPRWQ